MLRNRNLRYYNYFIKQKPVKYNNYSNSVAKIVFCSFNPNVKFNKNEVVIHKNKISIDNNINNLN